MTVLETLKSTVNTAVDAIQTVTQTVVEKNRTNAKLNHLRFIMKNESELMNRAYIALGKQYYEKQKASETISAETQEKLFAVIDSSKAKIAKARECYKRIVDSQNDIFTENVEPVSDSEPTGKIVDITVACSNDSEYKSSPFVTEDNADIIKETANIEEPAVTVEASVETAVETEAEEKTAAENSDVEADDKELF